MSYRLSQWECIAGQAQRHGATWPAVFASQSSTQCDWQGQDKAVIIPYYPCPFVTAVSHGHDCCSADLPVCLSLRLSFAQRKSNTWTDGQTETDSW